MAKEIETGEIVALKKIRMENEKDGVCIQATCHLFLLSKKYTSNFIKLCSRFIVQDV